MMKNRTKKSAQKGVNTPARKKSKKRASEEKWGSHVMDMGFSIIPSLLFRAQARLKLNPTQLAVLLHLADFWWEVERKPYPSKKLLGERLRLGPRQVQRHIADLEEMGLVRRVARSSAEKGKMTNEYDLSGLVSRLQALEPDFREVEEQYKKQKRAVERPGLKKRGGTKGNKESLAA